ncbi:MAG: 6-pyruvoyl trahydropterin synthase family protein [Planctomycetota bacterium]|jgi:6-pyruvoyltetrahydropterin/6-carboxytetrahydropterin synthase
MSTPTPQACYRTHFSAAHILWSADLSDAENHALYGPCARLHGHNYELEVAVSGSVDPGTGMAVNFAEIGQVVQEQVIEPCDHRRLETDVPFLEGVITTAENLAAAFWARLEPAIAALGRPEAPVRLERLRLFETHEYFVELARER